LGAGSGEKTREKGIEEDSDGGPAGNAGAVRSGEGDALRLIRLLLLPPLPLPTWLPKSTAGKDSWKWWERGLPLVLRRGWGLGSSFRCNSAFFQFVAAAAEENATGNRGVANDEYADGSWRVENDSCIFLLSNEEEARRWP
jgi:hypothetical protein